MVEMVKILDVRREADGTRTLKLDVDVKPQPGQFCMLWIPKVGEKPISFSSIKDGVEVTIKKVGPFTEALFRLGKGDYIGFRGPFGRGWQIVNGDAKICAVAGGCGAAPLMPVLEENPNVTALLGCKSRDHMLFKDRIKDRKAVITTEDGSYGQKGMISDLLDEHLDKNKYDLLLCCGPEALMVRVLEIAQKHKIRSQFALERFMKCAVGICGTCCMDPTGIRVCRDGPVFWDNELKGTEFGKYSRSSTGVKRAA